MRNLQSADLPQLESLLQATGAFNAEEIACALELLGIVLDDPGHKDYLVAVAEDAAGVTGYVLYGPTPLASGNVTIYWIAVDPKSQGLGVGRALVQHVEAYAARLNARLIYLETSSQGGYARTRAFYRQAGYVEESRLRDFYRIGDDRITYVKRLSETNA